ncbi:MAG: hypothetical protein ACKOEC_15870, partial [Acidimicrobiia bacterium]
ALRGLALFAVGDASAATQFQRAQLLGAPTAPARFLSGAARAMQSRDADAIAGWLEALKAGAPRTLVAPYLADAYLRRNDVAQAAVYADTPPPNGWSRVAAATLIAGQKEADAIRLLEARLAAAPTDLDAQWLLLHALFAQHVPDLKAAAPTKERFNTQARAYIAAGGAHQALAREWMAQVK